MAKRKITSRRSAGYTDFGRAMAMLTKAKLPTVIERYPTGRYGLTGAMPIELTKEQERPLSWPIPRVSLVWETEQEVIDALAAIGVTRYYRADNTLVDLAPEAN